jgi:hypothetical protein
MAVTSWLGAGGILSAAIYNTSSIPVVSNDADIVTPVTNQVIYNSTEDTLKKYTGAAWAIYTPNKQRKLLTTNETRTSTTTLTSSGTFTFPVKANMAYTFEGFMPMLGLNTADINVQFVGPAGCSILWTNRGNVGPAGGGSLIDYNNVVQPGAVARSINTIDATTNINSFFPIGTIVVAATAGNLVLQWAQAASSPTASTILAGAWLEVERLT